MLASYQNNNNNTQTITTTITHSSKKVYDTPPLSTASSLKTSKEITTQPSSYKNTNTVNNQANNVMIGVTYRGIEIKSHLPHITQQIIETVVISPKFKKWIDDFNLDLIDFREFIITDVDFFGQK